MSADFLWGAAGSAFPLLTTELNSLANGSGSAEGPAIDNSTLAYQMGRLELIIASNSLAFLSSSFVKVFFLPLLSTGGYPTFTSGSSYALAEANYLAATLNINPVTQSANVVQEVADGILIPQGKFKTVLVNRTGVTLPASGSTLNLIPTPSQY